MASTATETTRRVWDAVADGWDRHHETLSSHTRAVTQRMIELADVLPGAVVLEVGAGMGELSRALAGDVGPGGRVISTDLSARMVEAARGHTRDVDNLTFQVLDAQQMELDDDAVDVIVCKMGLMLVPDPTAAVQECRRVLRAGGRLVVSTWGPAEHNLWIATFGAAMLAHGHRPSGDPTQPGGIFSLSEPETVRDLLLAARFEDVRVETLDLWLRFDTFDDYWRLVADTSGPLTAMLQSLPADEVAAVHTTCREYAAHLRAEDGSYTFPGRAVITAAQ